MLSKLFAAVVTVVAVVAHICCTYRKKGVQLDLLRTKGGLIGTILIT